MSDLEKVKSEKFIYLTTTGRKTGKPHTVELWFATFGDRVYLSHEGDATDWMKNIRKNPTVKIRIGKVELAAKATSTKLESESREAGKKALYEKYYGPASKAVLDDWFELSEVLEILPTK